jgi:hypothetical protein
MLPVLLACLQNTSQLKLQKADKSEQSDGFYAQYMIFAVSDQIGVLCHTHANPCHPFVTMSDCYAKGIPQRMKPLKFS